MLMACFNGGIQFLSLVLIECINMRIYEIFIPIFKITIRFVRTYVTKIGMSFIDITKPTVYTTFTKIQ